MGLGEVGGSVLEERDRAPQRCRDDVAISSPGTCCTVMVHPLTLKTGILHVSRAGEQ